PNKFRKSEPGLNREEQQHAISSTQPSTLIWHFQESFDFRFRQEIHHTVGLPLRWNRKNALDSCRVLWALQCCVAKERPNRREAQISTPRRIGTILLE